MLNKLISELSSAFLTTYLLTKCEMNVKLHEICNNILDLIHSQTIHTSQTILHANKGKNIKSNIASCPKYLTFNTPKEKDPQYGDSNQ